MNKNKKKRIPKLLLAMRERSRPIRGASEQIISRTDFNLRQEIAYILQRASAGQSRVVGLGQLLLFSTQTGDAWLLDPDDELALCLMKEHDPQPYRIDEMATNFAIQWTGRYRIDGSLFAYIARETPTHARIIDSYPTDAIRQTIDRLRTHGDSPVGI